MIAAKIIDQVIAAGGRLAADGTDLVLSADHPLPADLLDRLKAHKPEILAALTQPANVDTLLVEACQDVEGIDAATFRALLSPEDVEEIAGGHYPVETLRAYAESLAEGIASGRIKLLPSADDRRRCRTCRNYRADRDPETGVCRVFKAHIVDRPPRCCIGYLPLPSNPDQRSGAERWPRGFEWQLMEREP